MKVNPSSKLYYRNKLYKLTCEDIDRNYISNIYNDSVWDKSHFGRWADLKIRNRYPQTFIYTSNRGQAEAIYRILKPKVVEIYGPINGYHKTLLQDLSFRVDIKQNLYHKKYRYQAIYGVTEAKETVDKIQNIVYSNKDGYLGQGLYYSLGFTSPRVFVKGDEELMFLKLATEEHIKAINRVVTIEEIRNNG
jgi:hypothetical protein